MAEEIDSLSQRERERENHRPASNTSQSKTSRHKVGNPGRAQALCTPLGRKSDLLPKHLWTEPQDPLPVTLLQARQLEIQITSFSKTPESIRGRIFKLPQ